MKLTRATIEIDADDNDECIVYEKRHANANPTATGPTKEKVEVEGEEKGSEEYSVLSSLCCLDQIFNWTWGSADQSKTDETQTKKNEGDDLACFENAHFNPQQVCLEQKNNININKNNSNSIESLEVIRDRSKSAADYNMLNFVRSAISQDLSLSPIDQVNRRELFEQSKKFFSRQEC